MRRIASDPRVLGGKPVIEVTRMSVEQILGLLANGMSIDAICEAYPILRSPMSAAPSRGPRPRSATTSWPIRRTAEAAPSPALLPDVNIAVQVVAWLCEQGVDIASVYERVMEGQRIHGILFLRPGDEPPDVVIAKLGPLIHATVDWSPPLVAEVRDGRLRMRRPPASP